MSTTLAAPARGRSALTLIIAGLFWGTGGLSGTLLATKGHLQPLPVAAYRLLLGGCCTVLFLWARGSLRNMVWTKPVLRRIAAAGVLLAQFQTCYFGAISCTSVSISTMVTIGSVPVFVVLATAVRTRRLPSAVNLGAVVIAVLGLVLLTWSPEGIPGGWRLAAGVGLALAAGAGFATLTLLTRRPVEGLDAFSTTAFGCLIGGLLLTPAGLWFGMALPLRPDVIAVALYFGLVPTGIGYAMYFLALRSAPAVVAALSTLMEPLTAAVLAAFVLHDQLGLVGWIGAALLVGALALTYTRT